LFLVVPITATFILAYVLLLAGIGGVAFGNFYVLGKLKKAPWLVAFPMVAWRYLVLQVTLSAIFVVRESAWYGGFPLGIFAFLHILLAAVFGVYLVVIKGGSDVIQERDAEIKQNVAVLRLMHADMESLARRFPENAENLQKVADALRYSDPMLHSSLAHYDEQIQRIIFAIGNATGNEGAKIPEQCAEILRLVADRNARAKIIK